MVKLRDESGQAFTEYILLLFVVVSGYYMIVAGLGKLKIAERLVKPIREDFVYAYKYGNPKARGYDEGTPKNHPRVDPSVGEGNFRIFINPKGNR